MKTLDDGWMGGWMDGWKDGKAGLRIAYSNQKENKPKNGPIYKIQVANCNKYRFNLF